MSETLPSYGTMAAEHQVFRRILLSQDPVAYASFKRYKNPIFHDEMTHFCVADGPFDQIQDGQRKQ